MTTKNRGQAVRAVTLQQVAERAGVGLATASYVLNNKPKSIGEDARERVWNAARELGYRPNMAARSLVTRQSHLVALWIPNVATAFSARVIEEIQRQAQRDGYDVMICDTGSTERDESSDNHNPTLQLPLWNVDGVIAFFGSSSRVLEVGPEIGATPIVSMGTYSISDTDFVELDLITAARQAVNWMFDNGQSNIGFLVPRSSDFEGDERREAYLQVLAERQQTPIFIHMDENTRDSAHRAMRQYLRTRPTLDGLFCYNDYAAIGASRALRQSGRKVGQDITIVGCDGIEDIQYLEAPLHTIALPIPQMCAAAWKMLQKRINHPQTPTQHKQLAGVFTLAK